MKAIDFPLCLGILLAGMLDVPGRPQMLVGQHFRRFSARENMNFD